MASKRTAPAKRARARRAPAVPATNHASPGNSAFELSDEEVERALQTGAYSGLLEDYFGPEQYAELRQLKRDASTRSVRGGPKVLVLPGIMGSKIGRDRKLNPFDDVVWVDPLGIARGHLTQIALPDKGRYKAVGVMLVAYLKLKLRLEREGYDADFYPFDWRHSINDIADDLKAKIAKLGDNTSIVAHSMGGLVARAAMKKGAKVRKLIMLGTPNHGSFAPVMAFRGTYPVVRKIGWLDRRHTAEELSRDVFSSFPGLTQMLPFHGHYDGIDLYDLASWPEADKGYAPRQPVLDEAIRVQKTLAPGDERMFMIAGVDQQTVVGIRLPEDGSRDLLYEMSPEGDGTVPLAFARLPGVKATYYVSEGHGSLANNAVVASAVLDLLEKDSTKQLTETYERPIERRGVQLVPESMLRVEPYEGTRGSALSQRELRELVAEVAAPDSHEGFEPALSIQPSRVTAATPPGFDHMFDRVRVGRNNYHRIDLRFAYGSITEADTRAIVLGLFKDVAPGGAAGAVDARMEGAITDLYRRRMFSANVGEVFMLPTGRHQLVTDFVAFVGLGPFDRFTDDVLQTASENTIRTLISARIEEFSTVLHGGGSGESPANALSNMLTGFLRGLTDADRDHHFRRIVICERDRDRYIAIKEELYRLSSTSLCENVELTFDEAMLRAEPIIPAPAGTRQVRREQPVYLIVQQEREDRTQIDVRASLLTAGSKAAVITGIHSVDRKKLEAVRKRIVENGGDLARNGKELASLILNEQVISVLPTFRKHPLVVVHDAPSSRIPWETIGFGDAKKVWFPAAEEGITHRYAAENLSVAKWMEERVEDNRFNVLLVVNPTGDLDGAEAEGKRVRDLLKSQPNVQITELWRDEATRQAVLSAFSSGKYDVLHYAGHAEFDEARPSRSGIVCANEVRLTGADLASISRLPTLVFFNACEAARVRGKARTNGKRGAKTRDQHIVDSVGLAEAFMRGGVTNFMGTYWPVGDAAAADFSGEFYKEIMNGSTLGEAVQKGREVVRKSGSVDWANYVLYGNADFALKDVL